MTTRRSASESPLQHIVLGVIVVAVALYKRFVKNDGPLIGNERRYLVSDGGLHIIQPFMDETQKTLLNDKDIWRKCVEDGKEGSFWMDRDVEPADIWEELVVEIWKDSEFFTDEVVGYEYWCNILTPDLPLSWHQDKDEMLLQETREKKHPVMGAVLYGYPHQFEGGELEVISSDMSPSNPEAELESVQAHYNRLIILNVTHWHRVTPISSGSRVTFAVNIWKEMPKGLRPKRQSQ